MRKTYVSQQYSISEERKKSTLIGSLHRLLLKSDVFFLLFLSA
eukprot:gene4435-3234_t